MKLKKILLPLATVASTAAVVTPVITSCGTGGPVKAQLLFDGLYERSEGTILGADSWLEADATKNYINAMANNRNLFGADCFEALSSSIVNLFKPLATEGIYRFANVKGSCGLDTIGTNAEKGEISAKLSVNITATDIMQEFPDLVYQAMFKGASISLSGTFELDNLKIKVVKFADKPEPANGLDDYIWGFKFDYLPEDPDNDEPIFADFVGDLVVKSHLSLSITDLVGISTKLHFNFNIDKTNDDYLVQKVEEEILILASRATGLPLGSLRNITVKGGQ
ncbi:MAG: hypothetical protein KBS35_02880 [Mycoplasma sp.]|nr:hypothetical protein [Candidatus Hennigella equi]